MKSERRNDRHSNQFEEKVRQVTKVLGEKKAKKFFADFNVTAKNLVNLYSKVIDDFDKTKVIVEARNLAYEKHNELSNAAKDAFEQTEALGRYLADRNNKSDINAFIQGTQMLVNEVEAKYEKIKVAEDEYQRAFRDFTQEPLSSDFIERREREYENSKKTIIEMSECPKVYRSKSLVAQFYSELREEYLGKLSKDYQDYQLLRKMYLEGLPSKRNELIESEKQLSIYVSTCKVKIESALNSKMVVSFKERMKNQAPKGSPASGFQSSTSVINSTIPRPTVRDSSHLQSHSATQGDILNSADNRENISNNTSFLSSMPYSRAMPNKFQAPVIKSDAGTSYRNGM